MIDASSSIELEQLVSELAEATAARTSAEEAVTQLREELARTRSEAILILSGALKLGLAL